MKRLLTGARKLTLYYAAIIAVSVMISLFGSWRLVRSQDSETKVGKTRAVVIVPGSTTNAGEVIFKPDTDHDGMSDEDETANGTDPNDASDADGDKDGDGLSNGDEVAGGSSVNNADSDNDGVSDGEEARLGYNPNDPTNTPPVNTTIVAIQVSPSPLDLSITTMFGSLPRQLQVNGLLNTGAIVDLTQAPGTTYQSLNQGVVVVDEVGRAAPVAFGTTSITVQNGNFIVQVPVRVASFTPRGLSKISIPGYASNVDVQGTYAFVAAGAAGLVIVDVSNYRVPQIVGLLNTPGNANDVKVVGNLAYIADGPAGLLIVDVSAKNAPFSVGSVDTSGEAQDLALRNTLAYVADGVAGLQIIDVSNSASPFIVGTLNTPGTARGVDVSGTLVAVADDAPSNALRVINAAQPATPILTGNLSLPGELKDVVIHDFHAYVSANFSGLRVVSLLNPSAPQLVGSFTSFPFRNLVITSSGHAFVPFTLIAPNGTPVLSTTVPSAPNFRGILDFSSVGGGVGIGVAVDQQYVYTTTVENGGSVVDNGTSAVSTLFIGRYQPRFDTAGVAPSTSVITPQHGQTFTQGTPIYLTANASDDIEVESVQFLVNDTLIFTDRTVPYEATYTVPSGGATRTIRTIATDLGGLTASSTSITINVAPNPGPAVTLLSPAAGSVLIEGQMIELLAQASDDGEVQRIVFTAGGTALPADTDPPFRTTFTVPSGVTSLTISATATDLNGQTATATGIFAVTPPTDTTVTGRVITSGNQPVAGANVSVFGEFFTQTAADGTFNLAGVPTLRGLISATASALVEGQELSGVSLAVAPAPGGITNVGNILMQSLRYETSIGNLVTFPGPSFDDKFAAVALPFAFTFYGVTYTQAFVGTNGYLTFGSGNTAFNETPTSFANGLPRIAPLFDDWFPEQTAARGVFVNTQLPGRVIFTWRNVEHTVNRTNDEVSEEANFQIILFDNGRIQFGYGKVETLSGLVGISPGGTPQTLALKHSALQGINIGATTAPYEHFLGIGDFPLDLQNGFISYTPSFGGYEVQFQRAPQTTVSGRLLDASGNPVGGARVTVFNRSVVTDANGSFNVQKIPAAEGLVAVKALLLTPGGQIYQAQSAATHPLVNGVTDVGDLTLAERGQAFETDFGQPVPHASGSFPKTAFPLQFQFRFYGQSFYGQTFDRVYVNQNGFLTLTQTCVKSGCNDQFGSTNITVNDSIFAFANTPVIAPLFSTLDPGNSGQVFVKSLPDKWVMTFVDVRQPGRPETNTFQVVLHPDGTIRFAYNGVGNKHGHVGLSPGLFWGSSVDNYNINWSTMPGRRMPNPYPLFETFLGDFGGLSGNNFDLDRNVMIFFPNNDGSYDVIRQQFTGLAPASKILFDSSFDGDVDLFSINPDGSNLVNLTNKRGDDYDATLSPDGSKIAFDSYRDDPDGATEEIYVMNRDGSDQVRLTNNTADDYGPVWSPDGTKILFRSNRNGDYEIFIMNADGSGQRSLTGYAGDSDPDWSPDGTKILVNSDRDGVGGLYVMNADGSGVVHLDNTGTFGGNSDGFATWSPDGSKIAFNSYRNGEGEIFIVNADGSGLFNLTNHPSADFVPVWSPDGSRILFFSFRDGNAELYVLNANGTGLVRLTNNPSTDFIAQWSPDGTQVVYTREEGSGFSLYIVNADGTGQRSFVNNRARNFALQWRMIP